MNKFDPARTIDRGRKSATRNPRPAGAARRSLVLIGGLCLMAIGCAGAVVQAPPPPGAAVVAPPPPAPYAGPTLPKLLGIPECIEATKCCAEVVCTCLKRQFPGPGAAAPNLGEVGPQSAPAVKCAAEIIAAEAEAPQKIDALRYLGKVGCTKCYPCVEEGLLVALDDCTEAVRYEAAKAIRATASEPCKCCQCTSCCTQKIFEKLYKVAYETNSQGCPVECSPRVRRVARQALCLCGGPLVSDEDMEEEPTPTEGPSGAPPAVPPAEAPAPATAAADIPAKKPIEAAAASTAIPTAPAPAAPIAPEKSASPQASTTAPAAAEKKDVATLVTTADEIRAAATAPSTPTLQETKPSTVPAPPAVEEKRATAAPILIGPTLRLVTNPAAENAPVLRPSTSRLRVVSTEPATECKACGTGGSTDPQSPNPFR